MRSDYRVTHQVGKYLLLLFISVWGVLAAVRPLKQQSIAQSGWRNILTCKSTGGSFLFYIVTLYGSSYCQSFLQETHNGRGRRIEQADCSSEAAREDGGCQSYCKVIGPGGTLHHLADSTNIDP